MVSQLERIIARQRRDIARRESPIYRALRTAYRTAITRLDADLLAATTRIEQAIAAGEPVNEAWLQREGRYRRLLAQADVEFVRFGGDARDILTQGTRAAALAGASDAATLLDAVGVRVASANLPVAATERLVASFSPESPLTGVLRRYGSEAVATIERRLVEAVTGGLGPRSVARQIARDLDSPLQRARLLSLVRNETLRSYRGGLTEQYQSVAHLLNGVIWICTLSPRTCKACLGHHLSEHPVGYIMESHSNCRCSLIANVHNSTVALPPSGDEWLASQPIAVRREVLGTAFDAYESGDITLADFVGRRTDPQWGTSISERSNRDVLGRAA